MRFGDIFRQWWYANVGSIKGWWLVTMCDWRWCRCKRLVPPYWFGMDLNYDCQTCGEKWKERC